MKVAKPNVAIRPAGRAGYLRYIATLSFLVDATDTEWIALQRLVETQPWPDGLEGHLEQQPGFQWIVLEFAVPSDQGSALDLTKQMMVWFMGGPTKLDAGGVYFQWQDAIAKYVGHAPVLQQLVSDETAGWGSYDLP